MPNPFLRVEVADNGVKALIKGAADKLEAKVEVVEKEVEAYIHPYADLLKAQAGRLESDIPMGDDYWKVLKVVMQREGR